MCDCRTKIEEKLLDRFKKKEPSAQDVKIEINGYALIFGDTLSSKPFLPIGGTYKLPNKNGELKTKKIKDCLIASFCPFCGVSLRENPAINVLTEDQALSLSKDE